ncbi:glycosyltransferase [Prevotella copri]|uniref:Glycosyltransferase n=1 Tax=Segatella copri TaxID=165179 RepID=A0AAW5IUA0_9BACT|nr:glycosyltransferase family 2 protein [Segatella copri]MCP9552804.1 glycosyltransferase [Segatella copri]MCP9574328.1 glycosyltransferase [Segatella copri]MCP9576650.1 glycosyltransferase [Segatella copri]MCP9579434.1 glycosyltransferase [Segatella copri]MCP9583293.1 glycosyltransferase [Segatella copri]
MIKYSYIIPHKDSIKLLLRCINSIEDKENSQIIVIDDNSKNQDEIIAAIGTFPSVELILSKHNIGAGAARNLGLKKAIGKWILFADADDFFNEGYIHAVDKYYNSHNDIIIFDTNSRISDSLQITENRFPEWSVIIKRRDFERSKWVIPVVWGKLYLRRFIDENSICFDEVFASNDVMFCYKANLLAKSYLIDDYVLYCSTKNSNSLCYNINEKNILCRVQVLKRTNALLRSIGMNKYQYNIFSLILLFRRIGWKKFFCEFFRYIKNTPLNNIFWDLIHTVVKIWSKLSKLFRKKNGVDIKQSVTNNSFYN